MTTMTTAPAQAARPMIMSMRGGRRPTGLNAVRADRASRLWGNPFRTRDQSALERRRVITLWGERLVDRIRKSETTRQQLAALCGTTLWCWCAPLNCHNDVTADAAVAAAGSDTEWAEWLGGGWRRSIR